MKQVFFITGTSRGIGKALAEKLLQEENNQVVGISRTQSIEKLNYRHVKLDLARVVAEDFNFQELFRGYLNMDKYVLVNNAGSLGETAYVGNIDSKAIYTGINVNVTAPAVLMNAFLQAFQSEKAEKVILNISSGAGKYPVDGWSVYCASKAALDMLSDVAALEVAKKGWNVKVYSVAPGVVDTAMQDEIRTANEANFSRVEHFKHLKQNNELANPADVAAKINYLIENTDKFQDVVQDVRKL